MNTPKSNSMTGLPNAEALPAGWEQQPPPPPPRDPALPPEPGRWQGHLEVLATLLGNRARLVVLRELAAHERLPVAWLAMRAGVSASVMSQHMSMLKKAGIVIRSLGRLYQLHPSLMPAPGSHYLDLGNVLLRLPPRR